MGKSIFDLKQFKIVFQAVQGDNTTPLWTGGIMPFLFTGHGDDGTTVRMIPEDDGQIAFIKRGALGDIWANKNYRGMKIWSMDIGVLPQHPDEFRFMHMLQAAADLDNNLPEWYIEVKNKNGYKANDENPNYQTWWSNEAMMVKIPDEFGYGYDTDGLRRFQFYLPNCTFIPGESESDLNAGGRGIE